jgi:hypothetical protein
VNIGTKENPKFANIRDYWNDETMEKIADSLCEYQDILPTTFFKMKGIARELGKMNILVEPDAKPVRQRPYELNRNYKEKVKAELDRMVEASIIESVIESEWISSMVVQDKNTGGIMICVDFIKLNYACLHDPFPTPFTDELLETIGGNEAYLFTDRFSRYHETNIALEDRHKTTFVME